MSDQITPVLAYRRLVKPDDRMAPSFLFESVMGGDRVGRYSFLGAQPEAQIIARGPILTFEVTASTALAALIGLAYGAIIAVYPVAAVAYFGLGGGARAYGKIFTAWGLAGLAGPLLAGMIYDATGSYGRAALLAAGVAMVSAVAVLFLPRRQAMA